MKSVMVHHNYLEYVSQAVSFRGVHNRSKVLLLWAISQGAFDRPSMRRILADKVSTDGINGAITRLKRYRYITQAEVTGAYRLLVKGQRFLWAATKLGHLDRWRGIDHH